jgi:hypothetical protein
MIAICLKDTIDVEWREAIEVYEESETKLQSFQM